MSFFYEIKLLYLELIILITSLTNLGTDAGFWPVTNLPSTSTCSSDTSEKKNFPP
ncbi:hypothetical protein ACXIHB_05225 [Tenacibaculum sp. IMCC1]